MKQASVKPIPLTEPTVGEEEAEAVKQAVLAGALHGNGKICQEVEKWLSEYTGAKHVYLTTSCTHALELSLMTLDIKPGDEVILPSYTFTSTANVIMRQGAKPVFLDIEADTFNLDPNLLEAAITPRTRCIMPVHYAGQGCNMDTINDIAARYNIPVVEDAAQGVGAFWKGQALGTLGDIGCYSFHSTKNVTCGEGGAFLTNNTELARRAEIIREKGTNRSAFLRGEVDKYTWVEIGSSFVITDLLAAMLKVQLGRLEELNRRRQEIWQTYFEGLSDLEKAGYIQRPYFRPEAKGNGHNFALLVNHGKRDEVIDGMRRFRISTPFHYVPLHSSPFMVKYLDGVVSELPVTERVGQSLIRLPLYGHMSDEAVGRVLDAFHQIIEEVIAKR
jgi:dTDP-4-amino-4,6-dideoxygalactose transaminase